MMKVTLYLLKSNLWQGSNTAVGNPHQKEEEEEEEDEWNNNSVPATTYPFLVDDNTTFHHPNENVEAIVQPQIPTCNQNV